MSRRSGVNTLSDAILKARSKGAKPARVSLILGGIKYKAGQDPARVCPAGKRLVLTKAQQAAEAARAADKEAAESASAPAGTFATRV